MVDKHVHVCHNVYIAYTSSDLHSKSRASMFERAVVKELTEYSASWCKYKTNDLLDPTASLVYSRKGSQLHILFLASLTHFLAGCL